jgi:hypothetical protein
MAVLLILLLCLGGAYALLHGLERRVPAASRIVRRIYPWLAAALLVFSLHALVNFDDDGAWIFLTGALLAFGLWKLPLPEADAPPPTWRERFAQARPWMTRLLLLALAGVAVLSAIEAWRTAPGAAGEHAATAPAEDVAESPEALAFHPLGPRRTTAEPRTVRKAAPLPAAPVDEPTIFWRLVERVTRREQPAPPAVPSRKPAPAAAAGAERRVAASAHPSGATAGTAVPRSAPAPAGVNQPVIDRMLARAETLLQQGRPQEAAAVAANVLAFDPANAAAKRIRQEAGGVAKR